MNDSLAPGSTYAPISFTIQNTGSETAQEITFSLDTIYPISPVNPNVYINSLAPGASTTVTFYVNVDGQGNVGQYPVSLYEQWTQPNGATNQQYSTSENFYGIVYKGGGSDSSYAYLIGAIIIVVIALVIYWRMNAAKKTKGK